MRPPGHGQHQKYVKAPGTECGHGEEVVETSWLGHGSPGRCAKSRRRVCGSAPIYLLTLLCRRRMPSLRSSPWTSVVHPNRGFSPTDLVRIRSRTSLEMTGRPWFSAKRTFQSPGTQRQGGTRPGYDVSGLDDGQPPAPKRARGATDRSQEQAVARRSFWGAFLPDLWSIADVGLA